MAISIPTTAELTAQNETNFETEIGQTIPTNSKAFFRVLSVIEAGLATTHYKHAVERVKQNLALTATDDDLDLIGANYGVTRKAQVSFVGEITQPANAGTSIPAGLDYVSDASGLRYFVNSTVVAGGGGSVDVEVTCEVGFGADGNLTSGETLTIGRQIAGITSTTATYSVTTTTGVDRESDTAYRRRVLQEIRTVGGGGNGADYRTWAEAVTGVFRAFPFSGAPVAATKKLKDGDMEETDVARWSAGNSASLSKGTGAPHGGLRVLQVARFGVNDPYAYQYSLEIGREYTVAGWARGNGAAVAPVVSEGSTTLWTGTVSGTWQPFSVNFTATATDLRFGSNATGSGTAAFDDCTLVVENDRPGDRVVYVESTAALDPDGIPDQDLLDDVLAGLTTDPVTGQDRMVLGTTEEKLFVEPIIRSAFDVEVSGLEVDAAQETALKASLDTGVDEYFRTVAPFATGIDSALDRNDAITGVKLSEVVQDILVAFGATAEEIVFEKTGGSPVTRYTVAENETAKLGTITYA